MDELFEAAQGVTILTFLIPMIFGGLIGALIISIKAKRKKSNNNQITVFVKFKNGSNFVVLCDKKHDMIFCPVCCDFKNKNPYKMSKHLKGHFKKDEGHELFTC